METNNIHLRDIERDIASANKKVSQLHQLHSFVSQHLNVFTDRISLSICTSEIIIWNPLECLEQIVKTWGQSDWVRVPYTKETINWERKFGDITIVLQGMEKCPPTLVPLNAWPIMLTQEAQ